MNSKTNLHVNLLLSSKINPADLKAANEKLKQQKTLLETLNNPELSYSRKQAIVSANFDEGVERAIMFFSAECELGNLDEIIEAYDHAYRALQGTVEATVICVTLPDDEQLEGIKNFIKKERQVENVNVTIVQDKSILGGFIIRLGDMEYDYSVKTKFESIKEDVLAKVNSSKDDKEILTLLRQDVRDFQVKSGAEEIGTVIRVGDGIATLDGLDEAMYGEIVVFENGIKGMVQDIKRDHVGVIIFGSDDTIHQNTKVKRTYKKAGIPCGEGYIGRVVNSLGEPIDGKGEIEAHDYRLIENAAPAIVDRKPVSKPLETGILSIDSMFPIGRGQRELIIGDRQTGKTSIATDTILNQKGKNCICIYNAIGQKASTVAKLVSTLEKGGAMDYTIVVCSTAADPAALQYISPYSATALAEYFMYKGKDCLIVYDDLSKHAVAYRALSLLLERSPGREAYPGDVFYLHSRLLERSSCLSDELGGGSITAMPVIETQAGDVSAYIPTNVISITDGQIFLESDLFFSGQRPAVNVGLSVSRVGGAAQTKAMKKAAGSLRVDLAQYREMEVFTQFSSDLDEETKRQLTYGKGLMELLKQPLGNPMSQSDMVVTLVAAENKKFVDTPIADIKKQQAKMLLFVNENYPEISAEIEKTGALTEEMTAKILKVVDEFKAGETHLSEQ